MSVELTLWVAEWWTPLAAALIGLCAPKVARLIASAR